MMKKLLTSKGMKALLIAGFAMISATTTAQAVSVCAQTQQDTFGITNSDPASTYDWWLSDSAAGTIDRSLASNDSIISVDWGTTPGTYKLFAQETSVNGCLGDTVEIEIEVTPLPTVAIAGDSVCQDFPSTVTFNLTGEAPWAITYDADGVTYTDTVSASPYIANLPAYSTTQTVTVTGLTDANGCQPDSTLPDTQILVYPKPTTGAIYHN